MQKHASKLLMKRVIGSRNTMTGSKEGYHSLPVHFFPTYQSWLPPKRVEDIWLIVPLIPKLVSLIFHSGI
jgi:hypothetical protein